MQWRKSLDSASPGSMRLRRPLISSVDDINANDWIDLVITSMPERWRSPDPSGRATVRTSAPKGYQSLIVSARFVRERWSIGWSPQEEMNEQEQTERTEEN
ncbi:hypothetical protein Pla52o_50010 [Novipirellula galeiformis]|uniref:Uncharacterized protein n=1 Tax=Novipirellula galeiformis TaxID=2528004 RepID=A0A5C6C2R5_9BACT|nr:hypothetical protein Pla52o_50010 [Novipirellula galeiformis]